MAAEEGGAWQGVDDDHELWQCGDRPPPQPADVIVLGDFNAEPGSPEYRRMEDFGLVDAWPGSHQPDEHGTTFLRNPGQGTDRDLRIDHIFLSPGFCTAPRKSRIDPVPRASDHQPVWLDLDMNAAASPGTPEAIPGTEKQKPTPARTGRIGARA
ncbi:MAG: endonuclease/exonuclease/phosphatase family protein [Gemmobacter sp.]|jgi:hypothetical protein|nr:endonuclease/exonuclease/phosphatase family protein [Gemmobacter sp.]